MNESSLLGAHTSIAGGLHRALLEGKAIGANTVQIFTSNQKQWQGRVVDEERVALWRKIREETGIKVVMSHDSYLINLGAPSDEILAKSRRAFYQELYRCIVLEINYLNFHPGAAVYGTREQGLDRIVESLLGVEGLASEGSTCLVLECTAGQGSSLGYRFEELAYIIDRVKDKMPIGVCIDTCHAFVAGYDLRTWEAWNATLNSFDSIVGLQYLKAFHLNDSLKGLGTRVDRHQALGEGQLGIEPFKFIMRDERTRHLPKYLETPGGPPLWKREIALLRSFEVH
jgi:deoxyribonuclease-4